MSISDWLALVTGRIQKGVTYGRLLVVVAVVVVAAVAVVAVVADVVAAVVIDVVCRVVGGAGEDMTGGAVEGRCVEREGGRGKGPSGAKVVSGGSGARASTPS